MKKLDKTKPYGMNFTKQIPNEKFRKERKKNVRYFINNSFFIKDPEPVTDLDL